MAWIRLLSVLLFCILTLSCQQETGTTSNPDAETLHTLIEQASAGDTVLLPSGEFFLTKPLQIVKNGTRENPVVIMGQPDYTTIIDASGISEKPEPGAAVWVAGSFVQVSFLTVKNSHDVGILVGTKARQSDHIDITSCYTENTYGSGISLWYVDSARVTYCEIVGANNQDIRRPDVPLRREAPHEALTVAGATHFEVSFNEVHHCHKEGIDVKEVSQHGVVHHNYLHDLPRQGLYADAWFGTLTDVVFRYNVVHDSEWGAVISVEGEGSYLSDVHIHDNLLYNNNASGVFFGQWGHDLLRENITIYNNTVFNNGSEGHWAGLTGGIDIRSASISHLKVYNNIVTNNQGFEIASFAPADQAGELFTSKDITIFNNLITTPKFLDPVESDYNLNYEYTGSEIIQGDPMFVNPQDGDFTLQEGSPAINASVDTTEPRDLGADLEHIERTLKTVREMTPPN